MWEDSHLTDDVNQSGCPTHNSPPTYHTYATSFLLKNCFSPKRNCLPGHSDWLGLDIWSKPLILPHTLAIVIGLWRQCNSHWTNQGAFPGIFVAVAMGGEPLLFSQIYEAMSPALTSAISPITQRSLFTVRIQWILREKRERSDRSIFMAFECLGPVDPKPAPLCPSPQFGYVGFPLPHHLAIS